MKKVKLLLTMAVIVFATMICCSMSAFALTDGDWEFQLIDNEVKITAYNGTDTNVVIPSTIYGTPVTKVEIYTFKSSGFENVESLEYPATVKEIKNNGVGKKLKEIILNEGTEIISFGAFQKTSICQITLPSTIKEIGGDAFYQCESLSKINLHSRIQKIGGGAFHRTGLTQLDLTPLPDNCVFDGEYTFADSKMLKGVKLNEGMTSIPTGFFSGCSALINVDIPNTVHTVGINAFTGCVVLENIVLPTSLKVIGSSSFRNCVALKEVVIPYGVEELSHYCFSDCPALMSLYIPDTVEDISTYYNIVEGSENCIIYCSTGSYAENVCKNEEISYLTDKSVNSGIHVLYNGRRISFHSYGQNPEILEGRTLVPLRSIFEAMGASVEWDGATSTAIAKRGNIEVKITIGASEIYKNGNAVPVDVPAQLMNSRTMVPARVIAEAFGADVDWNGNGRVVLITE